MHGPLKTQGFTDIQIFFSDLCKLGCVVRMVVDSILPHAQCGPNDHRNDAPPIIIKTFALNVRLVFQNEITVRALVESLKIISKRIIC